MWLFKSMDRHSDSDKYSPSGTKIPGRKDADSQKKQTVAGRNISYPIQPYSTTLKCHRASLASAFPTSQCPIPSI